MMTSHAVRLVLPLLAVVAATAAGCGKSEPPPAASTAAPAVPEPPKVPAVGLYVTNETSGDLSVIDAGTLVTVATIPLGKRPRGIAAYRRDTGLCRAQRVAQRGPGVDEPPAPIAPPTASASSICSRKLLRADQRSRPGATRDKPNGTRVFVSRRTPRKPHRRVTSSEIIESFKVGESPRASPEPSGARSG
jgi:YVTN family beta-propeller protein